MSKPAAQEAWETWRATTPSPPRTFWDGLPSAERAAWQAVVEKVASMVVVGVLPGYRVQLLISRDEEPGNSAPPMRRGYQDLPFFPPPRAARQRFRGEILGVDLGAGGDRSAIFRREVDGRFLEEPALAGPLGGSHCSRRPRTAMLAQLSAGSAEIWREPPDRERVPARVTGSENHDEARGFR